jgi:hypothetical protein
MDIFGRPVVLPERRLTSLVEPEGLHQEPPDGFQGMAIGLIDLMLRESYGLLIDHGVVGMS